MRGIGFNFTAQPQYLNVDRTIVDFVVVNAARLEQLVARQNALRSAKQRGQQIELAVGQDELPAIAAFEASRAQVKFELAESVSPNLALPRQIRYCAFCPPQYRTYAR